MLPRRSKRIKLDSSSTTASKPKVAKVAPKSKIKVAPKAKKAKVDRKPKKSKVDTELKQTNEDLKLSEQKPKQEVRNGRGALRDLPEMPLDIICEVFYCLRPLDLLRVARINKAFRDLLMHRGSTHMWKQARLNVPGLPEPFPGMSEPAFASLCFDSCCNLCARPRVRDMVWEFRLRLCNECKETATCPSTVLHMPEAEVYNWSERLLPHRSAFLKLTRAHERRVLRSEVKEIMEAWGNVTDIKEKELFITERKARVKEFMEHASKCREWYKDFKNDRTQEIGIIREQRYYDICKRLAELGYEEDIAWVEDTGYSLDTVSVFREIKPVTDQVWDKIKPTVIKYFQGHIRPRRIADEFYAFLEYSMPSLKKARAAFARSYGNVFPLIANFANSTEVRDLLDLESEDDVDVDFDLLTPAIPKILADWQNNVNTRLEAYTRSRISISKIPMNAQARDLAIGHILSCIDCGQIIPNTDVRPAIHDCSRGIISFKMRLAAHEDPYVKALVRLDVKSWHPENYAVLSQHVSGVLEVCGKDRLTTTEELDKLNPRLMCSLCSMHTIYRWRDAVIHGKTLHSSQEIAPMALWKVLSNERVKKLSSLDRAVEEHIVSERNKRRIWWCRHCEKSELPRNEVVKHVKQKHDIANPDDNDFFPNPDQPIESEQTAVYVIPGKKREDLIMLPMRTKLALETGRAAYESDL